MKQFSTRETARILEATEAQVRTYARLGQIVPQRRGGRLAFSFQDLLLLRATKGLLDSGVPSRRMRRVWSSLRRQLAADLPLTSITIFADGDRAVAWDGRARWQPDSGQFLIDFEAAPLARRAAGIHERASGSHGRGVSHVVQRATEPVRRVVGAGIEPAEPAPPTTLRPRREKRPAAMLQDAGTSVASPEPLTAEQWFHIGCELEDSSPLEARQAYQQALDADPDFADAHLNLGRQFHEAGELGKAEAHYREAVRCAPDDTTSHFNLGVLLEDRGRPDEAIHAYEQAIAREPKAADAHYNLGLLLESMGRRAAAIRHLMRARELYDGAGG